MNLNTFHRALLLVSTLSMTNSAFAGGEAGPIRLRDQGHFYVGLRTFGMEPDPAGGPFAGGGIGIYGQMYVGYQLPENRTQKYPLILVHGGGGQSTDYMGTPDGRDGWLDYFLAAGFDVYFVDRPAHGRSPNNARYGVVGGPTPSGVISMLAASEQFPGDTSNPHDPALLQHLASSEPGPTVDMLMLKENFAELLDRVGPAIVMTHSAGGPSGWLSIDARPDLVKALVAIEAVGTDGLPLTYEPALKEGESLELVSVAATEPGKADCNMQSASKVRMLPNFSNIPILGIVAPQSVLFTPNYHCTLDFINQAGGSARLLRLKEDAGIEGNGHFMQAALNNGEIARLMIEWMSGIE